VAIVKIVLAAAMASVLASSAARAEQRQRPPCEGVICSWALYAIVDHVGRECFRGRDPEFQAEVARHVARFDAYVVANSDATVEDAREFRRQQGEHAAAPGRLCSGDPVMMYELFRQQGATERTKNVDDMLARPGPPTWGTCL